MKRVGGYGRLAATSQSKESGRAEAPCAAGGREAAIAIRVRARPAPAVDAGESGGHASVVRGEWSVCDGDDDFRGGVACSLKGDC